MESANLQPIAEQITKNIQLYETMCVRWGVMLVGPTGGGKTSVLHALACALSKLEVDQVAGPNYRHVHMQTMNPKSISADELYGAVNTMTLEWKDGLLGLAVRTAVNVTKEEHQWVVCDGPVDAVWIENLNTVLDDNKMLCLANSERIKLTAWVHMVFEVQDLAQASPATVSRCGMVYVDPGELGWHPLVVSWRATVPSSQMNDTILDFLLILFNDHLEETLKFARRNCTYSIHQVEVSKISMMCSLLLATTSAPVNLIQMPFENALALLCKLFAWTMLWSIGGNFVDASRLKLEEFMRRMFANKPMFKYITNLHPVIRFIQIINQPFSVCLKLICGIGKLTRRQKCGKNGPTLCPFSSLTRKNAFSILSCRQRTLPSLATWPSYCFDKIAPSCLPVIRESANRCWPKAPSSDWANSMCSLCF